MIKTPNFDIISLISNTVFAVYHLVFGLFSSSWWLLTLGSYYLILSLVRFIVIRLKSEENFITKFTGWMLMILSIPLIGTVILSVVQDRGHKFHMILMIAMAAYSFTRITLAIIKFVKARKSNDALLVTTRNISLADAFASIFALQRSMLVSFDGMNETEIVIMNATLGSAVCIVCFLLGLILLTKANKRNVESDEHESSTESI